MPALTRLPVDEQALSLYRDALNGAFEVDSDGVHTLVGAEFSLSQVLNFYSGYDESRLVQVDDGTAEYPEAVFHPNDLIGALIDEVERLRELHELDSREVPRD